MIALLCMSFEPNAAASHAIAHNTSNETANKQVNNVGIYMSMSFVWHTAVWVGTMAVTCMGGVCDRFAQTCIVKALHYEHDRELLMYRLDKTAAEAKLQINITCSCT